VLVTGPQDPRVQTRLRMMDFTGNKNP